MMNIWHSSLRATWQWSCDVCHYGDNIPWEDVDDWPAAMAAVEAHAKQHRRTGRRPEWIPLRITRTTQPVDFN